MTKHKEFILKATLSQLSDCLRTLYLKPAGFSQQFHPFLLEFLFLDV